MSSLPEKILRLMSPADRRATGQQTAAEIAASFDIRAEKDLHRHIANYLAGNLEIPRGMIGHAPMNKRGRYTVGWPDFTIPLPNGKTLFLECKPPGQRDRLRPEQRDFMEWAHLHNHPAAVFDDFGAAVKFIQLHLAETP
jgi:hypothetical protein